MLGLPQCRNFIQSENLWYRRIVRTGDVDTDVLELSGRRCDEERGDLATLHLTQTVAASSCFTQIRHQKLERRSCVTTASLPASIRSLKSTDSVLTTATEDSLVQTRILLICTVGLVRMFYLLSIFFLLLIVRRPWPNVGAYVE